MSFMQIILIAIVAIVVTIDYNGPLFGLYRPLVIGSLIGLVLGDFKQGLVTGATLELLWLGVVAVGGYTPPDTISGAVIGTALGILSGHGATAGVAIAVPVAIVTQQLDVIAKTSDIYFAKKADIAAANGDADKIPIYHYSSLLIIVLFKVVPIVVALILGSEYVKSLFDLIPPIVMQGLNVAASMLPAVGFAMLLTTLLKKKMWPFLMLGFALSAFFKISTIGISIFGISIAFITLYKTNMPKEIEVKKATEEEYDL